MVEAKSPDNKNMSSSFESIIDQAQIAFQKQDYDSAIDHFKEALKFKPADASIYNNLGVILFKLDRLQEAEHHLKKAVDFDPDYFDALFNLAKVYLKLGGSIQAESCLEKALNLKPGHIKTLELQNTVRSLQSEAESRLNSILFQKSGNPLISVHMITWNQEKYIADSIRSVMAQTYQNFELVIVDDGSTDTTAEVIKNFNSDKIQYFYNTHSGEAATRNVAQKHCKGDFIAFLDSDDLYEPDILERELGTLLTSKQVDGVYTDLRIIDQHSQPTQVWTYKDYGRTEIISQIFRQGKNVTPFPSMMIRRELSDRVGNFNEDLVMSVDSEYIARMVKYGRLKHIPLPLYRYRRHSNTLSQMTKPEERERSVVLTMVKMLGLFSREELFPEVDWKMFEGRRAEAVFNYVVGQVFAAQFEAYKNAGHGGSLFVESMKHLQKALEIDSQFSGPRTFIQKLEALHQTSENQTLNDQRLNQGNKDIQSTKDSGFYDAKSYWTERGKHYQVGGSYQLSGDSHDEIMTRGLEKLQGNTLIEIGCGEGRPFKSIRTKFPHLKLTGTDISPTMIVKAKENFKGFPDVEFHEIDGKSLPYPDEAFDIAYTYTMFIHVPPSEIKRYIQEIMRIAKAGRFYETSAKVGPYTKQSYYFSHDYENLFRELDYDCAVDSVIDEENRGKVYLVTKRRNSGKKNLGSPVENVASTQGSSENLRILYLADCRSPHTQRYVRFFKGLGHDVHVFDTSGITENLEGIKLHFPEPVPSHAGKRFEDHFVHNLFSLNWVIEDIKPDILHGHYISGWGWWGAFTGFQPYFLTAWGSDLFLDPKISAFNRRFTEFCIRQSRLITADSHDLLNETITYGGKPEKMHYVPFGIDLDFFKDGVQTEALRNKLNAQGKKVVLSPRQFKEPANIDVIIKTVPEVLARFPETVFVLKTYLTGENDPYEIRLRDLIGDLNLGEHIRIVRDVDFQEMPAYYNLADVVLTLRDTDGTACTVLETMACKTPVIAGDIKSMQEWITDGETGLLVDQHDPGATAKAIIRILGDESSSRKMADAAHRNVHQKADYRKNWEAVNRLYGSEIQRNLKTRDAQLAMDTEDGIDHEIEKAWAELRAGRTDEAEQRFHSQLTAKDQVMVNVLRSLLGLAKIHWLKGDVKMAADEYTSAIRLLAQVELDQKVTLTKQ